MSQVRRRLTRITPRPPATRRPPRLRALARPAPHRPGLDRPAPHRLADTLVARPRTLGVALVGAVSALALLMAGAVAAVVAGAYTGLAVTSWRRRRLRLREDRERAVVVEAVAVLAADLRAGLPPAAIADDLLVLARTSRVAAACLISEQLGAPLADLLERVDVDLRAAEHLRAAVQAQTAGTRATAWLLAGLPLAGICLGISMGVDPVEVMLHTPVGAASVLGALVLQLAGLGWSARLVSGATRAVG